MSQILEATFDGQVFRPVQTVELQPDTQVEFVVTVKIPAEEKPKSFLRTTRALKLKGPKDFSSRIDDYLYGGANLDDECRR
jgi:predicted DNA-binding antitoxin AbrB/MazE fold protein